MFNLSSLLFVCDENFSENLSLILYSLYTYQIKSLERSKFMYKNFNFILTGIFVLAVVLGVGEYAYSLDSPQGVQIAQNDGGEKPKHKHDGPPPQEAIEACAAQSVGYTCEFMSPEGDVIQGVCEIMPGDIIACLPDNRPPHHKKDNHDAPPPDEDIGY